MRLIEYTVQKKRSVNLKTQQEKLSQMKHTREKAKKCTEISGLWGNGKWSNKLVIAASQRAGRKKKKKSREKKERNIFKEWPHNFQI